MAENKATIFPSTILAHFIVYGSNSMW